MDMHSGGGQKEKYAYIYIEAGMKEAKVIFYNRFGHSADRVTCTCCCCGEDYSVCDDEGTLEEITQYERGDKTVEEYEKEKDVLVIRTADIKPEERIGDVPRQGYVWMG